MTFEEPDVLGFSSVRWLPFKQRLQELGWIEGRNIRCEYRLTGQEVESIRIAAKELVAAALDVIVPLTNLEVPAALQERPAQLRGELCGSQDLSLLGSPDQAT